VVIYPFLQQNVLNYRDFMLAKFKKDLADSMTWQLLPLGAPAEAVQFHARRQERNDGRRGTGVFPLKESSQF
jgi:hypothetical protein